MQDVFTKLENLRRPPLLIRAAAIGARGYSRDAHLRRHFGEGRLPGSVVALPRLIALEADFEAKRRADTADYSPARHVALLIALIGEAQLAEADPTGQPGPRSIS